MYKNVDSTSDSKNAKRSLWNDNEKSEYVKNIMDCIDALLYKINNGENISINNCISAIETTLINGAKKTFQKSHESDSKGNTLKCKKSFKPGSSFLKTMKEYHKAKRMNRKYKSDSNYINLQNKSRVLKIEVRKEKAKQTQRFHNKIRNLKASSNKEYWKLIKSKENNNVGASISDLLSHFKNLNESNFRQTDKSKCDENACESNQMENKYIDCLNNPIEGEEIIKAIGKLKNGKSCGSDSILNEYIINTKHLLLPLYIYIYLTKLLMMANSLNHGVLGSLFRFSRIMARPMTQTVIEVLLC